MTPNPPSIAEFIIVPNKPVVYESYMYILTNILNGVWYLENPLTTTRKEDAVYVDFPEVNMGDVFTFRVKYEGSPQEAKNPPWDGGFVWGKDEMGRDYVSVSCEGDGCSLWWPMKDHISDEPDNGARMTFIVPQNLVCVSNGKLLETKQDVFSGKQSYTWEVTSPINNYNISVQLGLLFYIVRVVQLLSQCF